LKIGLEPFDWYIIFSSKLDSQQFLY